MFDVFTEELEVTIKDGLANLYWYRQDLRKAWLRSGINGTIADEIFARSNSDSKPISKRQMMDALYDKLRNGDFNRRLEVSRNFARILIEQQSFAPQSPEHRIEIAERCALKLRFIRDQQQKERDTKERARRQAQESKSDDYFGQLSKVQTRFIDAQNLPSQKRGYELEKIFVDLMRINGTLVDGSFKIEGEQLDGIIKFEGHYYLVELKWTAEKIGPKEIGAFYYKVDGRPDRRGILISMNGFTEKIAENAIRGRDIVILLFDGVHIANTISGIYRFTELLEHALHVATKQYSIYCSHNIT